MVVGFAAHALGSWTATLSITDDATGSPQTISLGGIATAPPSIRIPYHPIWFAEGPAQIHRSVGLTAEKANLTQVRGGPGPISQAYSVNSDADLAGVDELPMFVASAPIASIALSSIDTPVDESHVSRSETGGPLVRCRPGMSRGNPYRMPLAAKFSPTNVTSLERQNLLAGRVEVNAAAFDVRDVPKMRCLRRAMADEHIAIRKLAGP